MEQIIQFLASLAPTSMMPVAVMLLALGGGVRLCQVSSGSAANAFGPEVAMINEAANHSEQKY